MALARLGDRSLQPQHAVRSIRHRTACRRSAAESDSRSDASLRGSIVTIAAIPKTVSCPKSTPMSMSSTVSIPSLPCSWDSLSAAHAATTTSSIRSLRRNTTSSTRTSTAFLKTGGSATSAMRRHGYLRPHESSSKQLARIDTEIALARKQIGCVAAMRRKCSGGGGRSHC